jgi:hypothetical protein
VASVSVLEIPPAANLDRIIVYFYDLDLGQGHVTITCFGQAWTAYFGGMGGIAIREFVCRTYVEYLVGKLGNAPHLKARKKDDEYLGRILRAIKNAEVL